MNKINKKIDNLELNKMGINQCNDLLEGKAPAESIEIFMQKTYDLRKQIEKNMTIKLNGEVSTLQREINNRLTEEDIDNILKDKNYAKMDDIDAIKLKIKNKEYADDNEYEENNTYRNDDMSNHSDSDLDSELEDQMEIDENFNLDK